MHDVRIERRATRVSIRRLDGYPELVVSDLVLDDNTFERYRFSGSAFDDRATRRVGRAEWQTQPPHAREVIKGLGGMMGRGSQMPPARCLIAVG